MRIMPDSITSLKSSGGVFSSVMITESIIFLIMLLVSAEYALGFTTAVLPAAKASAKLGRNVQVKAVDKNAAPSVSKGMEQLLRFSENHSDVIRIKK